jgi:hypothetical protein
MLMMVALDSFQTVTFELPYKSKLLNCKSSHKLVDFEPPLIACVVSEANYNFDARQ